MVVRRAGLYVTGGNYTEAEPLLRRAFDIRRHIFGEDHPDVVISLNNLALLFAIAPRRVSAIGSSTHLRTKRSPVASARANAPCSPVG